jgi:hypothetical protein
MEDFQSIGKLFEFETSHHGLRTRLKNPLLANVAGSYEANMFRVEMLVRMLPNIVLWSINFQSLVMRADLATYGTLEPGDERYKDESLANRKAEEFQRLFNAEIDELRVTESLTRERSASMGVNNLIALSNLFPEQMVIGLNALMASVLTGSWTAFEVLAGDLWECALNVHPQGLSLLKGRLRDWNGGKEAPELPTTPGKRSDDDGRQIPLSILQKYKHDLSEVMGTVLRQQKKVAFQSIWDIREAYAKAFSVDFAGVRDVVLHTSLKHLAAVRNVMVHKAGIADKQFKDETSDCRNFDGTAAGDRVVLDGATVAGLNGEAIRQSVNLIVAVDNWIDRNATT